MTSTFLLSIDHGTDTDLLGIADELATVVSNNSPFEVLSSKPWFHPTLQTGAQAPSQSAAPTNQQQTT
jgi:hypothetical protein